MFRGEGQWSEVEVEGYIHCWCWGRGGTVGARQMAEKV